MSELTVNQRMTLTAPLERRLWDLADWAEMTDHPTTAATLREAAEHVESNEVVIDTERWTALELHEEVERLKAVLKMATEQAKEAIRVQEARDATVIAAWEALGALLPGCEFETADGEDADLAAVMNTLENELS